MVSWTRVALSWRRLRMAACRVMKMNRARMFTSGPGVQVVAFVWTSAARSRLCASTPIHGIRTRVAHSCTNFTRSDGSDPRLNLDPKRGVDPATAGWKLIALVSTLSDQGEEGGQYAASVVDASGSLGKYRYLLFDCYVTELHDNWGNTFYSEIDVLGK